MCRRRRASAAGADTDFFFSDGGGGGGNVLLDKGLLNLVLNFPSHKANFHISEMMVCQSKRFQTCMLCAGADNVLKDI